MTKKMDQREGEEAKAELQALYTTHRDGPRGHRLTMEVIRRHTKLKTLAAVRSWLLPLESGDPLNHVPRGLKLKRLNHFLDKAQDKKWLKGIMAAA